MEIHQNDLQKAIQKAKESSKELYLSRSITDPLFSTEEWKTLIPFITNNTNLKALAINCNQLEFEGSNLYADWLMGDECIKILMESLPYGIQTLRLRGRLK